MDETAKLSPAFFRALPELEHYMQHAVSAETALGAFGPVTAIIAENILQCRSHPHRTFATAVYAAPAARISRQEEERNHMKASKFSDVQKALIIKQGEEGTPIAENRRTSGFSQATYFNWKKKCAGLLAD